MTWLVSMTIMGIASVWELGDCLQHSDQEYQRYTYPSLD